MFKVLLNQRVFDAHRSDLISKFSWLHFEITLPFAPFPGLRVQLPMDRSWKIVSVDWLLDSEVFRCLLENEFPGYRFGEEDYEELRNSKLSRGWQLMTEVPATQDDINPQ